MFCAAFLVFIRPDRTLQYYINTLSSLVIIAHLRQIRKKESQIARNSLMYLGSLLFV